MFTTEDSYAPLHCRGRASDCHSTAVEMPLLPEYCRECAVTDTDILPITCCHRMPHRCPYSIPQRCRHCVYMAQSGLVMPLEAANSLLIATESLQFNMNFETIYVTLAQEIAAEL